MTSAPALGFEKRKEDAPRLRIEKRKDPLPGQAWENHQRSRGRQGGDGEDCWLPRLWLSLSAAGRASRQRRLLGPMIVVVPFSRWPRLGTEKFVETLDCRCPFQSLAAPRDREVCWFLRLWLSLPSPNSSCGRRNSLSPRLWSSLSAAGRASGRRGLLEPRIVVVPSGTHPSLLLPW